MKSTGFIYQKEVHDDHTVYRDFLDEVRVYVAEGSVFFEYPVDNYGNSFTFSLLSEVGEPWQQQFDTLLRNIYETEGITPVVALTPDREIHTAMVKVYDVRWEAVRELRKAIWPVQEYILKHEDVLVDAQTMTNALDYYADRREMTYEQMTERQFLEFFTADFFEAPF